MASPRYAAAPAVDHVAVFAAAAAEITATLRPGDLGARVPACPGWTSYDLVVHLGNVHAWAATILETGQRAPTQNDRPPSRRPREVANWYLGKAGDLLTVLRAARPDEQCWTFSAADRTQHFWLRRQAHEAVVHLVDLHQAVRGTADVRHVLPAEAEPAFGADGVAEVLEVFLPRMHARGRVADLQAPLLLNASDTGHTWLLEPRPGAAPEVRLVDGDELVERGTDLVTARATDLMLLLWKRLPVESPRATLDGDVDRLRRFLASPLTT